LWLEALCGREEFYEYVPGAEDEGDDLLAAGSLTPEQQASLDALRVEMETLVSGMTYDAATFPVSLETGACVGDTGDTALP
jgi:hypothetical protein